MKRWTPLIIILTVIFIALVVPVIFFSLQPTKFLSFFPENSPPTHTIIIYPDWFTPPEAYTSLAQTLSSSGFAVIIPRFPFNLPFLSFNSLSRLFHLTPLITANSDELIVIAASRSANHLASQLLKLQNSSSLPTPQRAIFLNSSLTRSSFANYQGLVAFISGSVDASAPNLPSTTAFINIPGLDTTPPSSYTPEQLAALLETIQIFTSSSYNPQLLLPANQGGV